MAYRNCFKNLNDDLNSGQYTSRQKARTIFKASVDLANNGGVYHKKTESGKNMGTYVGDVNISRDGKKCLIGATSYDTLLSVTNGKYLEQPVTFNIQDSEDLWSGSIYKMDLSGLVSIISYPDGSANTFSYPPNILANQAYPKLIPPSDQGLVVDPCYNVFYPTNMGADRSNHGVCYLNDERAYEQYRRPIPLTETYVKNYISSKNGFVGDYYYPMPFTFDCCNNHVASITETTGLTTFTLTDGTRQTRAATLGTLTVPSSIPINNIVSVSVGTDVTSIGDYAFYGATSLTSITIPSGVTSIGTSAFQGASSLTSVIIPTSVTSIGLNALLYSVPATLTTTTLSNFSVPTKTVGDSPFQITAPTSNSNGAFTYSSSNTAVATVAGTTITIVGSGSSTITASQAATANYTSKTITATLVVNTATPVLSNFSVPTKTFGESPFTITQPTSNNSTGAFTYSSSNTAVATVSGTTVTIVGAGSSIIVATQAATANYTSRTITATLVVNTATTSTFTLTDGTRQTTAATLGTLTVPSSIPISNIVSVSVGTDVTSIGDYAFYSASSLTAITIPSGVTSIGDYAFYSASSLTSVIIPTSVTSIGDTAFQYSGLTSVIFESSSNLSTLNVSIGSNPTFFGSGAVTVSTGPNNPPVMTNFNIDYTFPNIIYDVDLKTYTSDDSDLNNVSYTILPTAYCNIWYRDTLGDSWTGNTAQIKIRNSSGESIIKILGPSASDKNKWLSISIPLISESYSVILTIGGWPIECQMFIAKDSYVWNTNNGNPPIADGVNVFYSKSGFSNTTEQFTISNSNVEQPNGLTISGSNLTLNSNVFKQNSFKIKATNYGLTSNIANVTWNGPIF